MCTPGYDITPDQFMMVAHLLPCQRGNMAVDNPRSSTPCCGCAAREPRGGTCRSATASGSPSAGGSTAGPGTARQGALDWLQCIGLVHAGHDNEGVDRHGRSESSPSLRGGVQEADRAVVTGTASRRRGSGRSTASRVPRCSVGCRASATAAPRKRPTTALPRRTS